MLEVPESGTSMAVVEVVDMVFHVVAFEAPPEVGENNVYTGEVPKMPR